MLNYLFADKILNLKIDVPKYWENVKLAGLVSFSKLVNFDRV